MAEGAIETSVLAILMQNGFKILEQSRSSNSTTIIAKKGRFGGKKVGVTVCTSEDLLMVLNKERELHRKQGIKQKILFTTCESCESSFGDITIIRDPTELSTAIAS
ncbi:MAG: hypothetical protein ACFFGZ_03475 [Candidatus Thorarchaeota archaeon]